MIMMASFRSTVLVDELVRGAVERYYMAWLPQNVKKIRNKTPLMAKNNFVSFFFSGSFENS